MSTDGVRWGRVVVLIGIAITLYFLGRWLSQDLVRQLSLLMRPHNEPLLHRTIMAATAIYIALMVIPFTPAVELGFTMLMIFGGKLAFLVYVSTVLALVIAFTIGRLVPPVLAAKGFGALGLTSAQEFAEQRAQISPEERTAYLIRNSPRRLMPHFMRHRFLALAVLLNAPGNAVIGGGGGIALLAGVTGLFPFPAYLLTIALAVAPVPLFIFLTN